MVLFQQIQKFVQVLKKGIVLLLPHVKGQVHPDAVELQACRQRYLLGGFPKRFLMAILLQEDVYKRQVKECS